MADHFVEDPAERALFSTIAGTYAAASEEEQRAMIQQLRSGLPTIPTGERTTLIDSIERARGQAVEWEEPDF